MTSPPQKPSSRRFKLVLEYDGSRYSGWQKQTDARTIQGSLLIAAGQIIEGEIDIQGNGRTDAGVHALHYTAHLEAATSLAPQQIVTKLNELLPADIAVLELKPCGPRFHARHSCVGRSYVYQISRRKTAFARKQAWWVSERLDTRAMAEAARIFEGMHDFVAFAEKQELKKSTMVLINLAQIIDEGDSIVFRVVGSHFLWKMIRRLAGVLVEVGRGNLSAAEVEAFLTEPAAQTVARLTAPASGLFFERAFYDQESFDRFLAENTGSS